MANTTIVPKHIAEAIVSPRAHAEPIERDALLSCLRYLRVTNPVGLVEAHWFDPSGSYPCIGPMMTAFGVPMTGVQGGITQPAAPDICSSSLSDIPVAVPRQFLTSHAG